MSMRKDDKLVQVRQQLKRLKSSIVTKPPYCQGTLGLPDSDFTLFYGKEGNAHRINLSTAPPVQLQHLADACAPATSGVAGKVLCDGEVGKLDRNDFTIGFDVNHSNLVEVIRTELLVENPRKVRCEDLTIELHELNVYGKGAFFKAHVDTPRTDRMFGSLIIVFPTPHEGGALRLRGPGTTEGETKEWTFDSAALLRHLLKPSIAYVAYFGDTEYEVLPVMSGHRVTITYNLYYATKNSSFLSSKPVPNQILTNELSFRAALRALLNDASFLPQGGNLMFRLIHWYPLRRSYSSDDAAKQALKDLEPRLKGSDGVTLKILRKCGLDASLKILYEVREDEWSDDMDYTLADGVVDLPDTGPGQCIEGTASEYLQRRGGLLVEDALATMAGKPRNPYSRVKGMPVFWVTDSPSVTSRQKFEKSFRTLNGGTPTMEDVFWRIWIFARMGPARERQTAAGLD